MLCGRLLFLITVPARLGRWRFVKHEVMKCLVHIELCEDCPSEIPDYE